MPSIGKSCTENSKGTVAGSGLPLSHPPLMLNNRRQEHFKIALKKTFCLHWEWVWPCHISSGRWGVTKTFCIGLTIKFQKRVQTTTTGFFVCFCCVVLPFCHCLSTYFRLRWGSDCSGTLTMEAKGLER